MPVATADPIAPIENLFNTQDTARAAFEATRQVRTYKWTNATARAAQTGMTEGDLGDQADTDTIYRYDGTTWLPQSGRLIVGTNISNSQTVAGPAPSALITQAGTAVTTLSSSSAASIPFPATFPTACTSVIIINGDSNTNGHVTLSIASCSASGFVCVGRSGVPGAGAVQLRLNYIAVGY